MSLCLCLDRQAGRCYALSAGDRSSCKVVVICFGPGVAAPGSFITHTHVILRLEARPLHD